MITPCSELIEMFLKRVEKDVDFLNYFQLTEYQALELAKQRSFTYLQEAISKIILICNPSVDLSVNNENFLIELTITEKFLIVSLMYEFYLSRDISYLKCLNVNYTSSDLKVFDPSNARSTFMDMYKFVCDENKRLLDEYKNIDRLTGAYKTIDFASYDTES